MENKAPEPQEIYNDYNNFIGQQASYIKKLGQASAELATIEKKMKYVLNNLSEVLKDLPNVPNLLSDLEKKYLQKMMNSKEPQYFSTNAITVDEVRSVSIKQLINTFFIKLKEQPAQSKVDSGIKKTKVQPKIHEITFQSVYGFKNNHKVEITFGKTKGSQNQAFIDEEEMEKMTAEQVYERFNKQILQEKILDFIKAFTKQQGSLVNLTPLSILAGCLKRYKTIAQDKQIKENNQTKTNFFNQNKELVTLTNNINSELLKHKQISLSTQDKDFADLIKKYQEKSIIFTSFIPNLITSNNAF